MLLNKQRVVHSVVDHFLFRLPGLRSLLSAFHCTPGTVDGCVDELGKGHLLGLSPGGVYEAQFGDSNYQVCRFILPTFVRCEIFWILLILFPKSIKMLP